MAGPSYTDFEALGALAGKAQSGDAAAYERFLSELYPFVRMVVRKKVGPIVDADDLTQECLLGIHRSLGTYHPSRRIKPWIQAIIRYKIVDFFRAQSRRKEVALPEQIADVTNESPGTNIDKENGSAEPVDVKAMIARLPDTLRRAVELTKLEGLSSDEAARREGISGAALRKRVSRAYRKLAAMIERERDGEE